MALLASTTLGMEPVAKVRAEVTMDRSLKADDRAAYRLVVQSYPNAAANDELPHVTARPLASTQRAITHEELERGIAVDVVGLVDTADTRDNVVVAWVERGDPDLEYDALRARPLPGAVYGVSRSDRAGSAQIVLSKVA
jgi:hypothetical protein